MVLLAIWAVLATLVCICLALRNYFSYFGWVITSETEEGIMYTLEVNGDIDDIADRRFITFKVEHRDDPAQ